MADLSKKPVNGETLVALDALIRGWVLEQLKPIEENVTEEAITNIINNVLESGDISTGVTEERVQEIIDESVGVAMRTAY